MNNFNKSHIDSRVCKVDKSRRLVFGWGMICTKNGEPYFDSDNQHFPEDVSLDGMVEFMRSARSHKAMHAGDQVGDVVFAFPAFDDVIKSLGFEAIDKTGVIVGVFVNSDEVLNKFHSGEYTGFSIGGGAKFDDVEE